MEICKIEKILERQFNNDKFKHRIFINGEWGIGKTYYVNEFKEKTKEKDVIYTSFFGKTKVEDIRKEIKHQIITKKINNEKFEKASGLLKDNPIGKILKKIGQVGTNAIENKVGINLSLENIIDLIDIDKFAENMIIIFDDLERMSSNLKMIEILGLIEEFALTRDIVVIGYEKEIEKENKKKFKDFKEKIITREFKFEKPSKESYAGIAKKYELENSEEILEIWENFNCNNLRVFIKCLEFINEVKLYIKKIIDKELTKELIKIIVAIVIEENTRNAKNKYEKLLKEEGEIEGFSNNKFMLEKYERYVASHYFINDDRDYKLIKEMQKFYYGESILKDDLKGYFDENLEETFQQFFELAFLKSEVKISLKINEVKKKLKKGDLIADNVKDLVIIFNSYIEWSKNLGLALNFQNDLNLLNEQFIKMYDPLENAVSYFTETNLLRIGNIETEESKKVIEVLKAKEDERKKFIFLEKSREYLNDKEWNSLLELISKGWCNNFLLDIFNDVYKEMLNCKINLDYWDCLHRYMGLIKHKNNKKIYESIKKLEKDNSENRMFLYRSNIFKENYLK